MSVHHHRLIGVLLVNLGTPSAPTPQAVQRYLNEFLSDPKVVELPAWLWQPLLKGVISPRRSKVVAKNYQLIWQPQGSPLMVYSQAQVEALQQRLAQAYGEQVVVQLAMRYGEPSLVDGVAALRAKGCERIVVLPLYPHFSGSTTGTIFDHLGRYNAQQRDPASFRMIKHYADEPAYIDALAQSVLDFWQQHGEPETLLLSYHGLPQAMVDKGDPYQSHCELTTELLRERLAAHGVPMVMSFQSRFGKNQWLTPSTVDTLDRLANEGIKRLHVMCPGFSVDCLETLEEISIGCREQFEAASGGSMQYIPCLNATEPAIDLIETLVRRELQGWVAEA